MCGLMGEHKHNPTAIAAKNGELPAKPKKMSKREMDNMLMAMIQEKTRINDMKKALHNTYY